MTQAGLHKGYNWIQGDATTLPKQYGHVETEVHTKHTLVADTLDFVIEPQIRDDIHEADHVIHAFWTRTKDNRPFWLALIFEWIWHFVIVIICLEEFRTNCSGYVQSLWASMFYVSCQDPVHSWLIIYWLVSNISEWQCCILLSKGFKPGLNKFVVKQPDYINVPVVLYYLTIFFQTMWVFFGIMMLSHLPANTTHQNEHTVAVCTVCFYWIFFLGIRLCSNEK